MAPTPACTAGSSGGAIGTQRTTIFAKIGPAISTVGMAHRRPNSRVSPRSAFSELIAASGPGCGGTKPCSTDSPASAGMPIASTGTLARAATRSTTGTRSTTPTSKNSGMPIRAATPAIAQGRARGPTRDVTASTTRFAPPESVSSPPIIAPRATSTPTPPRVVPCPS